MTAPTITKCAEADLRMLLKIRHFERALLRLFEAQQLNGTTHTCLGQEYIPVAISSLLQPSDRILSNHRGHGHYIARYDDAAGLLSEIMGRSGAICGGVGGSQHIHRPGFLSTGVQGESVPVGVGIALHLKRSQPGALAVVFVGDGTMGQGALYEALNIAKLWELPLMLVVENNGIAQSTPTNKQLSGSISGRAAAFGVPHVGFTSIDVNEIRRELSGCVSAVREGRPLVVEFKTVRLGPHSKGDDTRASDELLRLRERDWYHVYSRTYPEQFSSVDKDVAREVQRLVDDVCSRPLTDWGEIWAGMNGSCRS